jgi:hypothetical protein
MADATMRFVHDGRSMYSLDDIFMMTTRIKTEVTSNVRFGSALLLYLFHLPPCSVPFSSLDTSWKGWAEGVLTVHFAEAPGQAKLSRMAQTAPKFFSS